MSPRQVLGGWERYQQKDLNKNVLMSYGYGDGGGGPTHDMVEQAKRMAEGIPGIPKVKFEFARAFFDRLKKEVEGNKRLPKWCGELYLEFHEAFLPLRQSTNGTTESPRYFTRTSKTPQFLKGCHKERIEKYPKTGIDKGWRLSFSTSSTTLSPAPQLRSLKTQSSMSRLRRTRIHASVPLAA